MATLTQIVGYVYNAIGAKIKTGRLTLTLQQDIISVDGTKVAPVPVVIDLTTLSAPSDVSVSVVGVAGSTSYGYRVVAVDADGNYTTPSDTVSISNGNATLSGSNYNLVSWSAVTGAAQYRVYGRTAGSELLIATTSSTSYADTGLAPSGALPTVNTTGGYINQSVYATVGASPSGVAYYVEYDPDPTDTSKPVNHKSGYWYNYWSVPNLPTAQIGTFVQASRGQALANYLPTGSVMSTAADSLTLGTTASATTKRLRANQASNTPELRYNVSTSRWQFSNDGSTFEDMVTPSGPATTISATAPALRFSETDQGVGLKNWDIQTESQILSIRTLDDSFASPSSLLTLNRSTGLLSLLGNVKVTRIRPEFQLTSGSGGSGRMALSVAGQFDTTYNIAFDGTNWNLDDTSQNGLIVSANRLSGLSVYNATAGTNPRTPVSQFRVSIAGEIYERTRTVPMGNWTSYTPTWGNTGTANTIGASTVSGKYTLIGKTCIAKIFFVFGAGSAVGSGVHTFSLPFQSVPNIIGADIMGYGTIYDASAAGHYGATVNYVSSTTVTPVNVNGLAGGITAVTPMIWAAGDWLSLTIEYDII
jgi:hypothetical protein